MGKCDLRYVSQNWPLLSARKMVNDVKYPNVVPLRREEKGHEDQSGNQTEEVKYPKAVPLWGEERVEDVWIQVGDVPRGGAAMGGG